MIEPTSVRSGSRVGATFLYGTVASNHVVIANVEEPAFPVPLSYLSFADVHAGLRGRAVNDEVVD